MATDSGQQRELRNETAVNVAGLLKGQTGESRSYRLHFDRLAVDVENGGGGPGGETPPSGRGGLGGETFARDVTGSVRLTRLRDGVMAHVEASGVVPMTCARCLREYEQPFTVAFDEEYRQTVDVRTGLDLDNGLTDDEAPSRIDENHELDLVEPLRQEILVALPMRPDCGPDCPGPDLLEVGVAADGEIDDRLAALASLLKDEQGDETDEQR